MKEHTWTRVLLLVSFVSLIPLESRAQQDRSPQYSAEIALSEDSLQLRGTRREPGFDDAAAGSEIGFGIFLNERRDLVATANYYVVADNLRIERLTILVGPMAYAALPSEIDTDVFAVAVGAEARYEVLRNPAVAVVGRGAYAPDILTFGSADKLWDVIGRAELDLTENVTGFVGYRLFEIDLLEGKRELEESLHVGVLYRF